MLVLVTGMLITAVDLVERATGTGAAPQPVEIKGMIIYSYLRRDTHANHA